MTLPLGTHKKASAYIKNHLKNPQDPLKSAALLLHDTTKSQSLQKELVLLLQAQCTASWQQQSSLEKFCIVTAALYMHNPSHISGTWYALLASKLVAAEDQPGGPYTSKDTASQFTTNIAVGYLFHCLSKPLPNVITFLQNTSQPPLSPFYKELLSRTLSSHETFTSKLASPRNSNKNWKNEPYLHNTIYAQVEANLSSLKSPVKQSAFTILKHMKKADKNYEIALLPHFFIQSLALPVTLPVKILGEANIYTWMAYSIYDDIIDAADIQFLSVANIAMRKALFTYHTNYPTASSLVEATFTEMDRANAWELQNCRFEKNKHTLTLSSLPHYGNRRILANRSFGHALGPLILAQQLNFTTTQHSHLQRMFSHYLIARQLNDDIHDWIEDVNAGHSSFAVTSILQTLNLKPGNYTFNTLLPKMRRAFWQESMQTINKAILYHVYMAQKAMQQSQIFAPKNPLLALITAIEQSVKQSEVQYAHYQEFLTAYTES